MSLWSQFFNGIKAPMPIEVKASQIASGVTINNSINIDHRNYQNIELPYKQTNLLWWGCKQLDQWFRNKRTSHFRRVLTSHDYDGLFVFKWLIFGKECDGRNDIVRDWVTYCLNFPSQAYSPLNFVHLLNKISHSGISIRLSNCKKNLIFCIIKVIFEVKTVKIFVMLLTKEICLEKWYIASCFVPLDSLLFVLFHGKDWNFHFLLIKWCPFNHIQNEKSFATFL